MSTQRCRSEAVLANYTEWRYARLISLFVAVLIGPVLFSLLAQPPILLPLLSLVFLTCAAAIALAAWLSSSERNSAHINLWDLSGAYAFAGFAAAMLSEPHQVVEFFFEATNASNPLEK